MRSAIRKLSEFPAYLGVCLAGSIARMLPLRAALGAGAALGRLAWLLGIRRRVVMTNLRIALGAGASGRDIRRTAARAYAEMGRALADFLRLPLLADGRWKEYISIEGGKHLEEAVKEGKGVIFTTGHLGCWELIPVALSGLGYAPNLVVRGQRNSLTEGYCNSLRQRSGAGVIPLEDVARGVLGALRRLEPVGILPDQDVRRRGIFVDFFGVPASTATGLAAFALRTGAPVVPCFMIREGSGHRLVIEPAVSFQRTGDRRRDLETVTGCITSLIEDYVRRYPDRYFWMHRRWKTRPSGRRPPYTFEAIAGDEARG